jgi:hypothetical protein
MRTYESALDITYATLDFIAGAITMPLRAIFSNVPGISLDASLTLGDYWGSTIQYAGMDSWGIWFWVLLLALILVYF